MPYITWMLHIESFSGNMQDSPNSRANIDKHKSYTTNFTNGNITVYFDRGKVKLPKLKEVKAKLHRNFIGQIKSADNFARCPAESIMCQSLVETRTRGNCPIQSKAVQELDLGIKEFMHYV